MNEIFYISKLIIKKKLKVLSVYEKSRLKEYYKQYPFSKHVDFENVVDKISEYSTINKDKAWETVVNKTNKNSNKTYFSIVKKPWFKYAAAASIILLVSSAFLLNIKGNGLIETPVGVNTHHDINIGADKATLTLEDGSNIVLEKGQSYAANNIQSNGVEIVYKPVDNTMIDSSQVVYNYLTIPRGGQFFIELEDGTKVWLNSESKLKYPTAFIKGKERKVELVYGEAYFDVSPSTDHSGSSFKVHTEGQEIEVFGTEFNIKAYHDENYIYTTLVEGKVVVDNTIQKEVLKPNEQSILSKENKDIIIAEVDVFDVVSWKNGLFSFKRKSLKDIMKVISRWYDVDILFLNRDLENINFKGVLNKNQSVEQILTIIKNTNFINAYDINGKTILIK